LGNDTSDLVRRYTVVRTRTRTRTPQTQSRTVPEVAGLSVSGVAGSTALLRLGCPRDRLSRGLCVHIRGSEAWSSRTISSYTTSCCGIISPLSFRCFNSVDCPREIASLFLCRKGGSRADEFDSAPSPTQRLHRAVSRPRDSTEPTNHDQRRQRQRFDRSIVSQLYKLHTSLVLHHICHNHRSQSSSHTTSPSLPNKPTKQTLTFKMVKAVVAGAAGEPHTSLSPLYPRYVLPLPLR